MLPSVGTCVNHLRCTLLHQYDMNVASTTVTLRNGQVYMTLLETAEVSSGETEENETHPVTTISAQQPDTHAFP